MFSKFRWLKVNYIPDFSNNNTQEKQNQAVLAGKTHQEPENRRLSVYCWAEEVLDTDVNAFKNK